MKILLAEYIEYNKHLLYYVIYGFCSYMVKVLENFGEKRLLPPAIFSSTHTHMQNVLPVPLSRTHNIAFGTGTTKMFCVPLSKTECVCVGG